MNSQLSSKYTVERSL